MGLKPLKESESSVMWFHTFNARGLGDNVKRKLIFDWLKEKHKGIVLLQETHSVKEREKMWINQWGGNIVFSHGSSNSRGVAILISPDVDFELKETITDEEGRVVVLIGNLGVQEFVICNAYSPTKDKPQEQMKFLDNLKKMLLPFLDKDLLLGGDFNVCTGYIT